MAEIIQLRRAGSRAGNGANTGLRPSDTVLVAEKHSIALATERMAESVADLIQTLEASHRRIRILIDGIPDPEAAARLGSDLATLSAALRDAKAKAIATGLLKPNP
jgi:hypothetical protein